MIELLLAAYFFVTVLQVLAYISEEEEILQGVVIGLLRPLRAIKYASVYLKELFTSWKARGKVST
jgi:hypothetical protein